MRVGIGVRSHLRPFLAGLAIVVASSCDGLPLMGPPVAGNLGAQLVAWQALGIDDYSLDVTPSSMWVPASTVRIEVRNGVVVSCRSMETGNLLPLSDTWRCRSIDAAFEDAVNKQEAGQWELDIAYDPAYKFIRTLWADVPGWVDEEYGYTFDRFERR